MADNHNCNRGALRPPQGCPAATPGTNTAHLAVEPRNVLFRYGVPSHCKVACTAIRARSVLGMKQKSPNTLYGYWNELRAGRIAPRRLEVEPSRIAGILSETFMLERINACDYQYRLAGTRLCELFGTELRCNNFLTEWQDADQAVLAQKLALICEQGAVITLDIETTGAPRHALEFEAILLPLVHTGNSINRIIGAMSLISPMPIGTSEPPLRRRLRNYEVIWPDGRPRAVLERGSTAPFQAPQGSPPLPAQKGERPQLRVFDGGRTWKKGAP